MSGISLRIQQPWVRTRRCDFFVYQRLFLLYLEIQRIKVETFRHFGAMPGISEQHTYRLSRLRRSVRSNGASNTYRNRYI